MLAFSRTAATGPLHALAPRRDSAPPGPSRNRGAPAAASAAPAPGSCAAFHTAPSAWSHTAALGPSLPQPPRDRTAHSCRRPPAAASSDRRASSDTDVRWCSPPVAFTSTAAAVAVGSWAIAGSAADSGEPSPGGAATAAALAVAFDALSFPPRLPACQPARSKEPLALDPVSDLPMQTEPLPAVARDPLPDQLPPTATHL
jgi:hypothetical protein